MTKEEAMCLLNNLRSAAEEKEDEAIDMAIEALQFVEHFDLLKEYQSLQEVVRCKDCRWWSGSQETMHNNHLCRNWSKFGSINTSADDYCSYGERKGGEDE